MLHMRMGNIFRQTLDPALQHYAGVVQRWKMLRDDNSAAHTEYVVSFWDNFIHEVIILIPYLL